MEDKIWEPKPYVTCHWVLSVKEGLKRCGGRAKLMETIVLGAEPTMRRYYCENCDTSTYVTPTGAELARTIRLGRYSLFEGQEKFEERR